MTRRISDLSPAEFRALYPPMMGGDSTMTVDSEDAIRSRIRELGQDRTSAHQEASQAWTDFETARAAAVAAGKSGDPSSDEYKRAEAASREYSSKSQAIQSIDAQRAAMMDLIGSKGPAAHGNGNGNAPSDGPTGFTVGDTLLDAIRAQAGSRALRSDGYQEAKRRGAFHVTGRKSVDAVLIQRAMQRDPETGEEFNVSREALFDAIRRGDPLGGMERMATLVTGAGATSGGALVTPDRLPGLTVPLRTRALRLVDMITVGRTDSDTVEYVEMTGFTNNAAETAEATAAGDTSGTKPESALALIERSTNVQTVAHWIPATKRALSDAGQLRTLLDQILRLGLDLRLDTQIASGSGVGVNLRGIYNTPGIGVVTRRVSSTTGANNLAGYPENALEVIHRAITAVRIAFFEPNAIGINPADYEVVRLARETQGVVNTAGAAGTAGGGQYLMGDPMSGDQTTIWGLRPVVSAAFTAGLPVVGDWSQIVLWLREGTQVLASDSHNDYFVRNLVAILAEFRAALGVLAPLAFCTAAL